MCIPGITNSKIEERLTSLKIDNFEFKQIPTHFWNIYCEYGHTIRTTVSNVGPQLLSRMLELTEVQEGVLTIVFKIAEDKMTNSAMNTIGRKIGNSIFNLFK